MMKMMMNTETTTIMGQMQRIANSTVGYKNIYEKTLQGIPLTKIVLSTKNKNNPHSILQDTIYLQLNIRPTQLYPVRPILL